MKLLSRNNIRCLIAFLLGASIAVSLCSWFFWYRMNKVRVEDFDTLVFFQKGEIIQDYDWAMEAWFSGNSDVAYWTLNRVGKSLETYPDILEDNQLSFMKASVYGRLWLLANERGLTNEASLYFQKGIAFQSIALPHASSNADSLSNLLLKTDTVYQSKTHRTNIPSTNRRDESEPK